MHLPCASLPFACWSTCLPSANDEKYDFYHVPSTICLRPIHYSPFSRVQCQPSSSEFPPLKNEIQTRNDVPVMHHFTVRTNNGQWHGRGQRGQISFTADRERGGSRTPKNRSQEWRFYELQTLSISPFSGHRLDSKRPTTSNTMHFSSAATHANRTLALSLKNFYSTMYCFVSPQ